jgi:hypothetical protein
MSEMSEYYRALKRGERPQPVKAQEKPVTGAFIHRAGSEWCVTRVPALRALAPNTSFFRTERDAKAHARRLGNAYGEPVSNGPDLPPRGSDAFSSRDEEMF